MPIHKDGDISNIKNFRPISVLPFISKIFEKLMLARLVRYLDLNNVLNNRQFGFRHDLGTSDALIDFLTKIYDAFNANEYTLCAFIDFKKAFDTVPHDILICKLNHYGVRGNILKWFKSYLSDRKMFIEFNGVSSSLCDVTFGVPQGTVLGPFLFIIYINDILNSTTVLRFLLYADDTTIFYSGKSLNDLFNVFNREIELFNIWTKANKILLNLDKTKYMIFSNKNSKEPDRSCVLIDGNLIERVGNYKYLGIIIDNKLIFRDHCEYLKSKLSRVLGILKYLRFLPRRILLLLYNTLAYPLFLYGILIWGSAATYHIQPLSIIQKKMIRVITSSDWLAHTSPLFKKLNVLKLNDVYLNTLAVFMFKILNLDHMPHIKVNILSNNVKHVISLRSDSIRLPFYTKSICHKSVLYAGPKLWNRLAINLKNIKTLHSFKKNLKMYYVNEYT